MLTMNTTCATQGCTAATSGKSKYCSTHKAQAHAAWKDRISADAEARAARDANFAALHARAHQAGDAAAQAAVPAPMVVSQHASPLNDASPVTQAWFVSEGVCGFAWITIRPGNSPFANWAKKHAGACKAYYGGVEIWVGGYGQSMQRKEAYAYAYAEVIREAGIKAYAGSRMD